MRALSRSTQHSATRHGAIRSDPARRRRKTGRATRTRGEVTPWKPGICRLCFSRPWSPPPDASDIVKGIHAMLHPRNIVLVGATDKPGNYAERIWNNFVKYGYEGGLYPVNAKRDTIWGVPCYKDFASLPEKPDHVLVLVPARFAVQVIRDAAAAGARSATIVTSGFSELQDEESQKLAAELQAAMRETGLAVTGPNCLGNLSAGEKLFTNIDDRIVTMEQGAVAIAGQSGAIVMAIRQALEDRGVGVGYMVTTGNEAGLETPDLMRYFAEDPSIKVIVVYLEGVRNTKAFRDACKAARAASKPVIALKLGSSEGGRAAAMAHTGALAGSIETFDAIATREGVIRVGGLDELIETTECFVHAAVPKGRPARRSDAIRRQARHADRRLRCGRPEFCTAQPACRLGAGKDARAGLDRRQSARCRLCRGGRSLRLHEIDRADDRRPRYRHRHHRCRAAESAARVARAQSAHRRRDGEPGRQAGDLYQRDVDRLHRVHQDLAQVAAASRGHAGHGPRGDCDQVAARLRQAAQGSARYRLELEACRACRAGEGAEIGKRCRARRGRLEEAAEGLWHPDLEGGDRTDGSRGREDREADRLPGRGQSRQRRDPAQIRYRRRGAESQQRRPR